MAFVIRRLGMGAFSVARREPRALLPSRSEPCYNVEIAEDAPAALTGCAPQAPARIECHIQMAVDLAVEIGADA